MVQREEKKLAYGNLGKLQTEKQTLDQVVS